VILASIILALIIFLVSGTGGLFSSKVNIYAYFENAAGIRTGAPVKLEGVNVGNVTAIDLIPKDHQPPIQQTTPKDYIRPDVVFDKPVRVKMSIAKSGLKDLRTDAIAEFKTAGVLGETFIDIDATGTRGGIVSEGAILRTKPMRSMDTIISASQSAVENLDALVRRIDRIMTPIENGQGTIGKFINDPELYNRLNATLAQFQNVATQITAGQGTIGKLLSSDELYQKVNTSVDKLNAIVDGINNGQGTLGKFVKDDQLYNNANKTIQTAQQLIGDINAGKGPLGRLAKDEEMAKKLDNLIAKLSAISDQLAAGQGTAGRLLQDPNLYDSADQALVEVRNLTKAIRQDPKKYLTIHFKVF